MLNKKIFTTMILAASMSKNWTRRSVLKSAGALALLPLLPRCGQTQVLELNGRTMGTYYRVRMQQAPQGLYVPKLKLSIEEVLAQTEALMSTYRPDSELSMFNGSVATSWQRISEQTARVVNNALTIQGESRGAFNPAMAPLVDYWGFGPRLLSGREPAESVPKELLARVSTADLELKRGFIRKGNPSAALDLNGIAKGDSLDRVAQLLEDKGVTDYLVDIGGEIRVAGGGPQSNGWRIGIDSPAGIRYVVRLNRGAVATSGDYVNYFIRDGKRYCHILDPRQGKPVAHGLAIVSVVADTAMQADAWATALLVMGPDDGWAYAMKAGMKTLFLVRHGENFLPYATPTFRRLDLKVNQMTSTARRV